MLSSTDSFEAQATGELEMTVATRQGRSFLGRQYHRGALKVLRPLYLDDTGQACVTVINPGGGYLSGDRYDLRIDLRPQAQAVLTTQSATRIYRTPGRPALQQTRLRLQDGSCLIQAPDELIAYADAAFEQHTTAEVHPGATLIAKDVVTPGWSPDGQPFRYRDLRLRFEVRGEAGAAGQPGPLLALDNLVLRPGEHGLLQADSPFGPAATHLGALLVVSPHADDDSIAVVRDLLRSNSSDCPAPRAEPPGGEMWAGVSRLAVPGFLVRALGHSTSAVGATLDQVINLCRARWFGHPALSLRKY